LTNPIPTSTLQATGWFSFEQGDLAAIDIHLVLRVAVDVVVAGLVAALIAVIKDRLSAVKKDKFKEAERRRTISWLPHRTGHRGVRWSRLWA
jgi:hypothetical protein